MKRWWFCRLLRILLFFNFLLSSQSFPPLFNFSSLKNTLKNSQKFKQHRINKRFVLHSQRWNTCRLSWAFRDPFGLFPSDEHFAQTKRVIADAIRLWSTAGNGKEGRRVFLHLTDLSPITRSSLMNVRRIADIDIFFAGFSHGDAESFDGRGGLVAHSAYPPLGIVHFDASEFWDLGGSNATTERHWNPRRKWKINKREQRSVDTTEGNKNSEKQAVLNLRYVAVHEIGHALGLRHSTFRNSVMNRYYKMTEKENNQSPNNQIIKLSKDDEMAIEELFSDICSQNYFQVANLYYS